MPVHADPGNILDELVTPLLRLDAAGLLDRGSVRRLEAEAIHVLREGGCRQVAAVLNDADEWPQRLAAAAGAVVVVNRQAGSEQFDSLRLGIEALPEAMRNTFVVSADTPAGATVRDTTTLELPAG